MTSNATLICVIGAGTMGQGIAQVALVAGHPVALVDLDRDRLVASVEGIRKRLTRRHPELSQTLDEHLTTATSLSELPTGQPTIVIEAVVEDLRIKHTVLQAGLDHFGDDCRVATNTSSLSITEVAAGLSRPDRAIGMHFFNPVPVMRLVEVVPGVMTDPALVEEFRELAVAWGKTATIARSTPGFIVNRVARPFYGEGLRLAEEGAAPLDVIDQLLRGAGGFRMGPFELMDLVGNDVNETVTRTVWKSFNHDPRFAPSLLQRELVASGRYGRKTGAGYYDYADGKRVTPPTPALRTTTGPPIDGRLFGASIDLSILAARASLDVDHVDPSHQGQSSFFESEDAYLSLPGIGQIRVTRGLSAEEEANTLGQPIVLLDRPLDMQAAKCLGFTGSSDAGELERAAVAILSAANIDAHRVNDAPGLVVARVVSMIINEAAEALHTSIASAGDIDTAMELGTNYPLGPLAWADRWSTRYVLSMLDALFDEYRDARYRASQQLRMSVRRNQPALQHLPQTSAR